MVDRQSSRISSSLTSVAIATDALPSDDMLPMLYSLTVGSVHSDRSRLEFPYF